MTLVCMIFYELRYNPQYNEVIICEVYRPIMFARFICAIILHLSLTDEVTDGLNMMKYTCNHEHRLHSKRIAYLAGVC